MTGTVAIRAISVTVCDGPVMVTVRRRPDGALARRPYSDSELGWVPPPRPRPHWKVSATTYRGPGTVRRVCGASVPAAEPGSAGSIIILTTNCKIYYESLELIKLD